MWLLVLPPIALSLGIAYLLGAFDAGSDPDEPERLTDGDDNFTGDDGRDEVYGRGGDDLLRGAGGDDVLRGEAGTDMMLGGAGNDQLGGQYDVLDANGNRQLDDKGQVVRAGGEGTDMLNGGTGNDRVFGGDGSDLIMGRDAIEMYNRLNPDKTITLEAIRAGTADIDGNLPLTNEQVHAFLSDSSSSDAGNDWLRGGAGDDVIVDARGSDTIYGDTGNDTLVSVDLAPGDSDRVVGGFGNDTFLADDGDVLTGGAGNDTFGVVVQSDVAEAVRITDWAPGDKITVDVIGKQNPTLTTTFDQASNSILVSEGGQVLLRVEGMTAQQLAAVQASITTAGGDANAGDDLAPNKITGDAADNQLTGTSSVDHIRGLAGNDIMLGGDGSDKIGGRETVTNPDGTKTQTGGEGDDLINAGAGNDKVFAADGNDRIFGADLLTLLNQGVPADERVSVEDLKVGNIDVSAGAPFTAQQILDFMQNSTNSDLGDDLLRGGAGNDLIADVRGSNTIHGDLGRDQLVSLDIEKGQADKVFGGYGRDTILADDGDVVSGGAGTDSFEISVRFDQPDAVQITDWEAGEKIRIELTKSDPLSYSFDEANNAVLIRQGETTLVDVRATTPLTAADIARVQASVSVAA